MPLRYPASEIVLGTMVYVAVPEDGISRTTVAHPIEELTHEPRLIGQCPDIYPGTPLGSVPGVVPVSLFTTPGPLTINCAPGMASIQESVACIQIVTVLLEEAGVGVGATVGATVGAGVAAVVAFVELVTDVELETVIDDVL